MLLRVLTQTYLWNSDNLYILFPCFIEKSESRCLINFHTRNVIELSYGMTILGNLKFIYLFVSILLTCVFTNFVCLADLLFVPLHSCIMLFVIDSLSRFLCDG